jgi:uncharacterized protein YcfJ
MQTKLAFKVAGVTLSLFTLILPLGDVAKAQDRGECERFARDYARRESRRGGGLITGAARGGVRTGIVGGIFGDRNFARDAAQVGAVIGGISNSARRARNRDELYDIAFNDCMRGSVTPY